MKPSNFAFIPETRFCKSTAFLEVLEQVVTLVVGLGNVEKGKKCAPFLGVLMSTT